MSGLSKLDAGNVSPLLASEEAYPAPAIVVAGAGSRNFQSEYQRSIADPAAFWAEQAAGFVWEKSWDEVLHWDGMAEHQWFAGAKLNITVNALDRHAHSDRRDRLAYISLGEDGAERRVSYGELYAWVCRFARRLQSLGAGHGDRVVIYMPLTLEAIVAMLACARIGAIHSVVYAGLGAASLRERIQDAAAKIVIAADVAYRRGKPLALKEIVDEALAGAVAVEHVVILARATAFHPASDKEVDFQALPDSAPDCPATIVDAEHPLFILYTSGTSGRPKGVLHVHGGYMVGTTYHLRNFFGLGPDDVFWCTFDLGSIFGHTAMVYAPLCAGVTTLFREGAIDYPDPAAAWKIVERYKVTRMFTSPSVIRMFMRYGDIYPRRHDLTSLRLLACAGEPLNPEAWRWAQTHLCGDGKWGYCVDNWWQTEVAAPTIGTPRTLPAYPGKAGVPQPGVVADVVDESGSPVPPDQGGHLVLRRPFPHMMRGVWGDRAQWRKEWELVPGCYSTGDVAIKDKNGYFTIVGRADDVLNVAGHRIGTAEVESALVSHPAVAEAAAIGVPDPVKGDVIKCFVQLRAGYAASEALCSRLLEHVRKELGPIATPAAIEFVAALPKTRSGKIMRRYLKAKELGADTGDLSTLDR